MWWCSLERRPSAEELLSSCLAKIKGTSAAEAALLATCFGTAEAVPLSKTDCFDSVHPTHRKCAMDGARGLLCLGQVSAGSWWAVQLGTFWGLAMWLALA